MSVLLYSSRERGRVDCKSLSEELVWQKAPSKLSFHPPDEDSLCSLKSFDHHGDHVFFVPVTAPDHKHKTPVVIFFLQPFSSYFCHVPDCRLSFFTPSYDQMVVADLTLEESTCLNLLFSSCMLGDLGLARWSPPLLFSPFPPPSARITWRTEDRDSLKYNHTQGQFSFAQTLILQLKLISVKLIQVCTI